MRSRTALSLALLLALSACGGSATPGTTAAPASTTIAAATTTTAATTTATTSTTTTTTTTPTTTTLPATTTTAAGDGPPDPWGGLTHTCQYERLVVAAEAGESTDIAVVGSSVAFRGIYAGEVAAAMAEPTAVHTAATPGKPLNVVSWWTTGAVVPLLEPDVVVVAFLTRDLILDGPQQVEVYDTFRQTPGWAFVERGDLAAAAERLDEGGPFRAALHRPDLAGSPVAAWDVSASTYEEPGWLTEAKWESTCSQVRDVDRDVFTGARARAEASYFERELTPYDLGPGFEILSDLSRDLQAAGVTPVLLALPAPPDYLDAHAAGGVSYDDFRTRLEDLAGAEEILLIDATDLFGDDLSGFRDIRHLNVDGALALSRALGPVLDDLTPRVVCLGCG